MPYNPSQWDDLGRRIEDIVDRAVSSRDFQKLNQTIRQAVETGEDALRTAMNNRGRVVDAQPCRPQPEPQPQRQDVSLLYGSVSGATAGGILKIVGGGLLCGLSLAMFLCALVFAFFGWPQVPLLLVCGVGGIACGGGLIGAGSGNLGRVKRFKLYRKALGEKTQCALEKLAQATGKSVKFVRKDLKKMIDSGLFLEGHLDNEGAYLITSHATFREFEHNRLLLEQRQRQSAAETARRAQSEAGRDPRLQDVLNRGNAFIAQIRRCNDAIPGQEISAKIDRMETIVRRIFQRAEAHPEVAEDLKKLLDYYLPMTVKLLNAYADMDAQEVQGATIAASKKEIEDTLDTLNLAFEKLLDDLFKDTALDVSSDISVLQTLLAQEGLTEDPLTKK